LKVRLFPAADQTLLILDIRKTLQALSCKVCGGDSWTRTNDPIDVNDVLSARCTKCRIEDVFKNPKTQADTEENGYSELRAKARFIDSATPFTSIK